MVGKGVGLFDFGVVASSGDGGELRTGDQLRHRLAVAGLHDAVVLAPQHQRLRLDRRQPVGQPRMMHEGVPAIERQRFPVAVDADQLGILHRVVVGAVLRRVVPHRLPNLGRMGVEHVEDIGRLAVADLDAEAVHQHQLVHAPGRAQRQLGRQPATEGGADQRDLARQRLQQRDIEVQQVVDTLKVLRPRAAAEAGVGGRDDLHPPAQQVQPAGIRARGLEAVQPKHRVAGPAAPHLQLNAVDGDAIGLRLVRHGAFTHG